MSAERRALQRLQALAAELENCYARWDALESSGAGAGAGAGAGGGTGT